MKVCFSFFLYYLSRYGMSEVEKTPLHKKWWVWVVGILLIIAAINGNKNESASENSTSETTPSEVSKPAAPSFSINTDKGYFATGLPINAGFFFKDNGSVIYVATGAGFEISAKGKYKINSDTKEIELSKWDEVMAPKGNISFTVEGTDITSLTNSKGVVFILQ